MKKRTLIWLAVAGLAFGLGGPQNIEGRPPQHPSPPEVRKTTDSITGKWSGKMTATIGGAPPETFDWTMDCKPVSFGAGASCNNEGRASIGPMSESCLLAFDP